MARDRAGHFDRKGWRACADFGLLRMPLPRSAGGLETGTLTSLMPDLHVSLALFAIMAFCHGSFAANIIASIQFITPSRVRGLNASIYMLVLTLGAVGIGAALVGGISDGLFRDRADGISLAMAIVACGAAIGAVLSSRYALGRFRIAVAKTGGLPEV